MNIVLPNSSHYYTRCNNILVVLGIMPFLKGVRQDTSDVKIDFGEKTKRENDGAMSWTYNNGWLFITYRLESS